MKNKKEKKIKHVISYSEEKKKNTYKYRPN